MLRELNEELLQVQAQLAGRYRVRQALDAAHDRLRQARDRIYELDIQLDKENNDVRQLEGLSLTGLFYTVLGTKEQRLDTERQEALAARLRYDEVRAEIALLEAERETGEQQMTRLRHLDARYERILAEKERIITASDSEQAQTLFRLSDALASGEAMLREVDEAIQVAQEVLHSLGQISSSLGRAGDWGIYDMLGGGMIATSIKHGHIDDARKAIARVQHLLRRLRSELADIQLQPGELGDVDSFETFADYFFDGLIMDWVVQSRINRSAEHVHAVARQVQDVLRSLEQRRDALQQHVQQTRMQRRELLETVT